MTHHARIAALQAQGLHSILAQFCDIHGVAKGKLVPVGNLGEWVEQGAGFSGPSIWGTGLPRMGPRSEYYGRIQPESLRALPYMPGVAHAVCDGFAGAQPLAALVGVATAAGAVTVGVAASGAALTSPVVVTAACGTLAARPSTCLALGAAATVVAAGGTGTA